MNRSRVDIRRRVAITYLGGCCAACGSTEGLEFDHIDPATKKFDIGDGIWQKAEITFWLEVEKCQLLCRPHHVDKTRDDIKAGRTRVGAPSKLTPEQVEEALRLHRKGRGFEWLGQHFGVATTTVWRAVRQLEGNQAE
jgi:5-methylcytosine-specific restriction endonuclease McrA